MFLHKEENLLSHSEVFNQICWKVSKIPYIPFFFYKKILMSALASMCTGIPECQQRDIPAISTRVGSNRWRLVARLQIAAILRVSPKLQGVLNQCSFQYSKVRPNPICFTLNHYECQNMLTFMLNHWLEIIPFTQG